MTTFHVIIPARFASTRLPGKMLANLHGKPLLQHTYERAIQSKAKSVTIATDDEKIKKAAEQFGAKVCLTSNQHPSGTSRIAEAAQILGLAPETIIINVQGDEPLIPPANIDQVAEDLASHPTAHVATLCVPLTENAELFNPNNAKVVLDHQGFALYFSRAPIAWERDNFMQSPKNPLRTKHYRHLGIYAYRVESIQKYVNWSQTELEVTEQLEQLRVLYHGGKIHVALAKEDSLISVDSPEDLARACEIIKKNK